MESYLVRNQSGAQKDLINFCQVACVAMENIQDDASGYPTIFMTAGLNDPRVAYWEPAKWAAKLRERGAQRVLAKFDLSSGHFSASDRYKYIAERCWDHAVVLAELGLPTERPQ